MKQAAVNLAASRLILIFSVVFTLSCSTSRPRVVEAPPAYQPPPPSQAAVMPALPAKINEVEDAVRRVFKDAVTIDSSREPNFFAGDFNGDQSQDIAVVIKPAVGKISEMNQENPPWILKDPFAKSRLAQVDAVDQNDVLLAIIHGYGPNDWRDSQATQTFLLKNAVGSTMEVHKGKDFVAANIGRRIPRTQGDLIHEVVRGSPGYLYYTGPTYSWYDPKTFKGDPEMKLVHPGIMPKSDKD